MKWYVVKDDMGYYITQLSQSEANSVNWVVFCDTEHSANLWLKSSGLQQYELA